MKDLENKFHSHKQKIGSLQQQFQQLSMQSKAAD